ncbi:hypothetical protein ISN45_Aa03g040300 [Arabidopsis thaliana x Arabidopsis arenosa]|uniref:Uncharacterized protein n=1 Tax=Arabidopsis thaliana x Arabidopsis arenosa TaxID=1240361 RepID=A0A8T2AZ00_9BRAS|nr:hypothetical protein ISN45_Aa03g040300 [Arabidopsis thaliana x Arabidopsis arenosa]
MAESMMPGPTESPEDHRSGYFYVYEIYFKGCGLTFPLPEALVRYLEALEIALPQLTPNLLRTILGIITVAAEAGYVIGVPELNELLRVKSSSKKTGYFSAYPNANRNLISHLPNKDENKHHPWFLIKKTPTSVRNLSEVLPSKWSAKPAFIAQILPTEEFIEFFKIVLEGETLWNSFTLDRFIEANQKLRMSPPRQLHRLPPPPSTQGMSARAFASQRNALSKPMTEACEENKVFLATVIDKKDYSRTLLVDDGSAEGARSADAFRSTPRRERRGDCCSVGNMISTHGRASFLLSRLTSAPFPALSKNWKTKSIISHPNSRRRKGRLSESESTAYTLNNQLIELNAKYKVVVKLRDSGLARSASKARKEVKGCGMELIQGAILFIQTEKARSELESDIKEHESNLLLLDQIHEEDFSEEQERFELKASLSEKRSRLTALPASSFNPQHFEEFFTESPPLGESGLDWADVAPVASSGPVIIPDDDCIVGNEPGTSSEQVPAKDPNETLPTEVELEIATDP